VDAFDYGRESAKWAPFVTETFRALRRDGVRALVLDLRENEGGSDEGAEFLLRHLLRRSMPLPPLRRFVVYDTVPADLRPYLDTWDNGFYNRRGRVTAAADGTFDVTEPGDWPAQLVRSPDAFDGPIFIVTSYVNSSASHFLLRLIARQPGITLVGDPSGGSLRGSTGGQLFFARYPGTGFEVDLPLIAYDWGRAQPTSGVQPDIAVPARVAFERAMTEARRAAAPRPPAP
jgi:C-terminal processing protease CtpA/Prc